MSAVPAKKIGADGMTEVRSLVEKDRARLLSILIKTRSFTSAEIDVAMELIDSVLKNPAQKDYQVDCLVDDKDQAIGYICYGPVPMTEGTFDLYWIAVDPDFQEKGAGSKLLSFLERVLKTKGGRLILADTSTVPHYEKTQGFYLKNGFREIARISDYYRPGNDRVTFCKKLNDRG